MQKFTKAITAIMLMTAMFLVPGCKKEDNPNSGGENNSEIINPNYVPIDWDNATLLSANDSIGDYQIQFNGEVPELQPGSIIAIREGVDVRYAFVEIVIADGNKVSMTTSEAYLTDIFANTDFTLATNPSKRSSANGKVFYPVAAYILDEQGDYRALDLNVHRDDGRGFTHDLWQIVGDFDNHVVHSSSHDSIIFKKLNFNLDIDLEMYMNFSSRDVHEIVNNAIDRYRSRALNLNAYLVGTFDTEQMLRCKAFGNFSWNPGYEIWKPNLFRPIPIEFVVEGVPVVITLNSDLYRQVQVTGNGDNITATTGFTDHAQGRVGFQWSQFGGISPEATFSNTFEFAPPPTLEGKGSVTAKVWAIPRIRLILYHALGPSFDFKPYLSNVVSGGFKEEMLGQSNDFCAWSLDCNAGLDATAGLSLQFMGYEVQNYSTPNWNIINKLLYHSPLRIEHNDKGNGMKLGQRNEVSFTVYDRNHLFNTDVVTPLPQFVKFETNGEISSEYGIAQDGQVSVEWTPTENDTLYAKLYDIEGSVIACDTVMTTCDCNLTSGDWVDLGLPSGLLWATRNVGASSATDYGNYFAWGETIPKSMYYIDTYQYYTCGYQGDDYDCGYTKYCDDPYHGYFGYHDNLTILQSVDDAATANYGGRMPTKEEWQELFDNTTIQWVTLNGVNGGCFTGPNGNDLFLPHAGYCWLNIPSGVGGNGFYWSSSLSAVDLDIESYRSLGRSVRAVREN